MNKKKNRSEIASPQSWSLMSHFYDSFKIRSQSSLLAFKNVTSSFVSFVKSSFRYRGIRYRIVVLIIQLARQFTVPHLHTIPAFCFRCLHYNRQHYPSPFGMSINIAFLAAIKFQDSSVALNVPIQIITIRPYELERPFVDYRIEPCGLWSMVNGVLTIRLNIQCWK